MGVAAPTPLLARFSMPVGEDQARPGPSVVRNGDFSRAAEKHAAADQWQFSSDSRQATCTRQRQGENGAWAMRVTMGGDEGKDRPTVMLAQHDVPAKDAQWYRISLRAKAEGMSGKSVNLALQNTKTWTCGGPSASWCRPTARPTETPDCRSGTATRGRCGWPTSP